MAIRHGVYDTDIHLKIDPTTRTIANASAIKKVLIQHDHNSERITFELPRYIDSHDMLECDVTQVHYKNESKDKKKVSAGVYEVDDFTVSPMDANVIIGSWLVSRNATCWAGPLSFQLKFKCIAGDVVEYEWNTAVFSELIVSDGMDNIEEIEESQADIISQHSIRIKELERLDVNSVVKTVNNTAPDENGNVDLGDLEADWNTLKNRPFYTEEGGEVDVLAETEITMSIADAGDDGTALYQFQYLSAESALFSLVDGETYLLAINGELYEAIAIALENGSVYIGNTLFLGSDIDNGLPFMVASGVLEDGEAPEYVNIICYLTNSTDETITIPTRIYQGGEVVHPLNEKYLPKEAIEAMIDAYMEDALGGEY